jgi:two-component system nitrogen regulation response regulator GlnG
VPIKANVRLLAATHQNLEHAVQAGHFREDLFHRLNVIRLRVPSLRERREDIPLLAQYFLQKNARASASEVKRLSAEAMRFISEQDFPGNVRELENLCNWIHVMTPAQMVTLQDLPLDLLSKQGENVASLVPMSTNGLLEHTFAQATEPTSIPTSSPSSSPSLANTWQQALRNEAIDLLQNNQMDVLQQLSQQFERILIMAALQHTKGRKNEAAQKLGMGRNTIARKIQELGLDAQIETEN